MGASPSSTGRHPPGRAPEIRQRSAAPLETSSAEAASCVPATYGVRERSSETPHSGRRDGGASLSMPMIEIQCPLRFSGFDSDVS
eukprot:3551686-Pleurochrysis_carterae.AAC.1